MTILRNRLTSQNIATAKARSVMQGLSNATQFQFSFVTGEMIRTAFCPTLTKLRKARGDSVFAIPPASIAEATFLASASISA